MTLRTSNVCDDGTFMFPKESEPSGERTALKQKKESQANLKLLIKVAMTYSPTNVCSTIGAVGLNFSVRDGKRWNPNAINRLNISIDF